jgi:hypothetical protein
VRLQQFYTACFNPYLNYHRRCAQADITFDEKGRRRCLYRRYQTPLETLLALPNPAQYLRPGLTPAVLQRIAGKPQRHRSGAAHAAGETPTLRAVAATGEGAVETRKSPKTKPGFFGSLESANHNGALSTFPPPRLRLLDWFRIYPGKELPPPPSKALPQAHSSIGKDYIAIGPWEWVGRVGEPQ